jgi:hypothetical protein
VKYLTSPEAGYLTGEIIGIDGGFFKVQNCERAHEYARARGGDENIPIPHAMRIRNQHMSGAQVARND